MSLVVELIELGRPLRELLPLLTLATCPSWFALVFMLSSEALMLLERALGTAWQ
jgi:hypothetical protein